MTHAYFVFYHSLGNICIRAALRKFGKANNNTSKSKSKGKKNSSSPLSRFFDAHLRRPLVITLVVLPLSYFTAFMETATIAHFPHYRFRDRSKMYSVGSLFYAIYFFVSFPWFFAMDEEEEDEEQENEANGGERGRGGKEEKLKREKQQRWSLGRAATDALAAGMLVTILLDAWRLLFGGIVPVSELPARRLRLPWML
jgi:cycloeucalenol cycloisomerase